ncbi:hypothetical protein [Burkholderia glumae]|uniref:hypothetical protein n=1 Tax=Burkholderia glumae TaxID=337 RepID=UPI0013203085|nr:hypothetical protein [Burkholderia glumae]QHE11884.1 hypothetical protein GQR88_16790 [Burkholderia glumae AU6208]
MNDKELLELAAKAAGIIVDGFEDAPWLEIRYGYTDDLRCPSGYLPGWTGTATGGGSTAAAEAATRHHARPQFSRGVQP